MRIVAAVASRDPQRAAAIVRDYHRQAAERITGARKEDAATAASGLTEALTTWLGSNVTLGGTMAGRRGDPS